MIHRVTLGHLNPEACGPFFAESDDHWLVAHPPD